MITLTKNVFINLPKEKVFSFVSDYRNDPKWRSGVLKMTQEPDEETKFGTKTFETIKFIGRKLIVKAEVSEFQLNKKVKFKTLSAPMKLEGFREVSDFEKEKTDFTYSLSAELTGIYKMFKSSIEKMYGKRIESDLLKLKKILEDHK